MSRLAPPAFAAALLGSALIVLPPCVQLVRTDWKRYGAPAALQAWFTGDERHNKVCWLFPAGQPNAGTPSLNHCMPFAVTARRVMMSTYVGHCFGFLGTDDAVVSRVCVEAGVSEYKAPLDDGEQAAAEGGGVLERARKLVEQMVAMAARHRANLYRGLQLLLLLDALLAAARSGNTAVGAAEVGRGHDAPQRAAVLTTHHLWLAVAVLTMLLDHYANAVLHNGGSALTMPAQLVGAPLFYHLAGANPRPDAWRPAVALVAAHAVFLELVPLPGDIHPYTLVTIATLRLVKRAAGVPSRPTVAWTLLHAAIAAALVCCEDLLGYAGLQLAYGCRAFCWGLAGHYRARSVVWRDAADCAALPYQAAALIIHVHLTLQNCVGALCRSMPGWRLLCTGTKLATVQLLLGGALVLHRYRYRRLVELEAPSKAAAAAEPSPMRLTARGAYLVAHNSLAVYVVHLAALVAYDWAAGRRS